MRFTRVGEAWSEISAQAAATYRIRLGGLLHSAWMVGVCSGLAEHELSIERAHARLSHDGSWIAELHVHALPDAQEVLGLQLLEFAQAEAPGRDTALCLRDYELITASDHGGTLRLTLRAEDSVGLLGGLLAALAKLSLLPVEMHIDTRGAEAHDRLWLAKADGRPPSGGDRAALDRLLHSAVQH
jgi:hypothetical protein